MACGTKTCMPMFIAALFISMKHGGNKDVLRMWWANALCLWSSSPKPITPWSNPEKNIRQIPTGGHPAKYSSELARSLKTEKAGTRLVLILPCFQFWVTHWSCWPLQITFQEPEGSMEGARCLEDKGNNARGGHSAREKGLENQNFIIIKNGVVWLCCVQCNML